MNVGKMVKNICSSEYLWKSLKISSAILQKKNSHLHYPYDSPNMFPPYIQFRHDKICA